MNYIRLAKKIIEADPTTRDKFYKQFVVEKIREKYSLNEELAILRQRDTKPAEFEEYNAYVEKCKAEVKAELEI
jgi:hypothetical protein